MDPIAIVVLALAFLACFAQGFALGRRAVMPAALPKLIEDVAKLKASADTLVANDEALRESITIIDDYLQKQAAKAASREVDLFGKLSGEIRQHLGIAPREDEKPVKDDAPKPTKTEHIL